MQRLQRRDIQDWLNLFEQQKQSVLTAVEFCRQQQINVQTYYTRRRDIRLQRTSSKFVQVKREVTKVESYTEEMAGDLLLKLGNAQLSLPTDINPHWVAAVMKALGE
ncbi:IS66 family insertion sequence element accessory protein TnpA [Alteromonas hispanica]|uniref:IS66 family insertion sequence element accessory protein TnpB n=1 Tax=Alteromonas hispanica TaxID=315421 RepID=A0A6L9MQR3_9ALTE|nr:IS66 family insertion sequence element accessory protein TnpB [Alteromonas hispanica]NDW20539.1 IS66 family insertion sequence element accessory protein TnpB [Alteromonas hispanica]